MIIIPAIKFYKNSLKSIHYGSFNDTIDQKIIIVGGLKTCFPHYFLTFLFIYFFIIFSMVNKGPIIPIKKKINNINNFDAMKR